MAFLVYGLKRIFYAVIVLLAVIVLNFLMMHAAPGDITQTIAQTSGGTNPELVARIREMYGLDDPLWEQLLRYVGNVMQGDLGYSFYYNQPVTELILQRLAATLLLVFSAQILALVFGTLLGVIAALRPNGVASHLVTLLALFSYSAPIFWTGIMMLIAFSLMIPIFPVGGMQEAVVEGGWFAELVDVAHHMVLPVVTLGSVYLAIYSRLCRASMLEVFGSDYVRTARAKGLSQRSVIYKHALKNSLGPVVTFAGMQFSRMISGAVLTETVFSWPGLGTLAFQSIVARDTPTILGILFFSALLVIVGNLVTDFVLRLIDPRIKTEKA